MLRRAKAFKLEKEIMDWYVMRQCITLPALWTTHYDNTLGESIKAMNLQLTAQKLFRPSVLWNYESSAAVYGLLYFILIFSDRIVRLMFGDGAYVLLAVEDEYSQVPLSPKCVLKY